MLGLFSSKKIKTVFFVFVFLMLNWFVVSPIYGVPSTTCNYPIYHTYACDGDTRYYCVRSTTTTSSGSSTRYYWTTSACGASGEVCRGGSCVVQSCSGSCLSHELCIGGEYGLCAEIEDNGFCPNPPKACALVGNCASGTVCKDTTNCAYYGGSVGGNAYDCFASSGNKCCDEDGNISAVECKNDAACTATASCKKCAKDGTIDSYCYSYTNSGTNGVCGGANGTNVCEWANLGTKCNSGSEVATDSSGGDGTFNWNCNGIPAGSCPASVSGQSCSATNLPTVDGVCGSINPSCTAPTTGLCTGGNASAVTTNVNTFSWACNGSCGGASPPCSSTRLIINGACGTADGNNFTSTPVANLCSIGTATAVNLSGSTYSWNCNSICNGVADPCSAVYDTAPNLSTTVLKNNSGTVIAVEAGGRNHSCDATFAGNKTSLWTVTSIDANGVADIKQITLRFRSATNTYSYGPTTAVGGAVTFTVDTTSFTAGTYNAEVLIEDQHTPDPPNRGWLDTGRDFYIWNCQVIVDGTIYDNSTNLGCVNGSTQGFTTTIPTDIQPFEFAYGDLTDSSTRNMTVTSPKFYSPQILTWQNTYFLDNFDSDDTNFLGVFNNLKINNVCIFPRNTHILPRNYVDAYSASPTIDIKYSAVIDQEAWFRVKDGSVLAKVEARNYVPVTCVTDCKTSVGGLVWSNNVNLSGSDVGATSEVLPQPPSKEYYAMLKYDFNNVKDIGTTFIDTTIDWPEDIGDTRGVIFVEGDLSINQNVIPTGNDYVFFVVKGKITIASNVTQVNGLFYTDTIIEATGENDTQLKISGSLYGRSGVNLSRSYANKRLNNTASAVEVTYDPSLIFKLPKGMWETYDNWTME